MHAEVRLVEKHWSWSLEGPLAISPGRHKGIGAVSGTQPYQAGQLVLGWCGQLAGEAF